jgi:hypothetical protein
MLGDFPEGLPPVTSRFAPPFQPWDYTIHRKDGRCFGLIQSSLNDMARFIHACWVSFQIGAGQDYNVVPDEEDLRSNRASILDFIQDPNRTAEESHQMWMDDRIAAGWRLGPVKDKERKIHPDLVPFELLPEIEQKKDINHIHSLRAALDIFIPGWR